MVLPQVGVHLFQGGGVLPPTGWLDKPLMGIRMGIPIPTAALGPVLVRLNYV